MHVAPTWCIFFVVVVAVVLHGLTTYQAAVINLSSVK